MPQRVHLALLPYAFLLHDWRSSKPDINWLAIKNRFDRPFCNSPLEYKVDGKRRVGRPRLRWEDSIVKDIKKLAVKEWWNVVTDRNKWQKILREAEARPDDDDDDNGRLREEYSWQIVIILDYRNNLNLNSSHERLNVRSIKKKHRVTATVCGCTLSCW